MVTDRGVYISEEIKKRDAEIERLRAAMVELLWYTNHLELAVYDPAEWPSTHGAVRAARAALEGK